MSVKSKESTVEFERFCLVLSQIPIGRVCSYGRLSELVGLGGPRQAARLLKKLPKDTALPWHRIVSAQGKLSTFSKNKQQQRLLENEGLEFTAAGRFSRHYYVN